MKNILLTFTISLAVASNILAQQSYENINFDNTNNIKSVFIDSVNFRHNVWQIGKPQKSIFKSAYSIPNAIVTDTINPYPINDTSSFIITHIVYYPGPPNSCNIISGMYYVNSDSINDYGKIEYSLNNGSWSNINDNTTFWGSPNSLPVLTGNSNGWKSFNVIFHTNSYDGDTLRFRFTFISDNIQTNKDGLMFDNISIDDQSEGIKEFGYDYIQSKVFPDPVSDNLNIELENKTSLIYQLTITDTKGNIVKS